MPYFQCINAFSIPGIGQRPWTHLSSPNLYVHLLRRTQMDEAEAAVAVAQMRNAVEKLGHSGKEANNSTLLRFLRARCMNPDKAAKMFAQHQKWRCEFVPLGYVPEREVWDELQAKKVCLQGPSDDGLPLVVIHGWKHYPSKDFSQFQRFVVHLLDKAIASAWEEKGTGNEKIMAIVDLQQLTYKNIDIRGFITGFQFLQAYYPERLEKLFMVNMPPIFASAWKIISRFLDKATHEKIIIANGQETSTVLLSHIRQETLPREYGGRGDLVPLQDVKLPHWPPNYA